MNTKLINELFDLSGMTAIVTGGAQGMGQAIGYRLAEAGAAVAIAHRGAGQADTTVARIVERGGQAIAVQGDISIVANIERLVAQTVDRFGGIDILVNNAGGIHPFTPFTDVPEDVWQATIDRNLRSCYFMSQHVLRQMFSAGGGGAIVNIASVEATRPFPLLSAYSATKAAIVSITRSLAFEAAPHGIRVNAISPGPIRTPNTAVVFDDPAVEAAVRAKLPLGRIGEPDDVARAALFLASPAAAFITGVELPVDGGFLIA